MYLLVYVDDILVAGSDIGRSETEAYLKTNYNMTVAGRPKGFLGFEVNYVRKGEDPNGKGYCILHQTRYVNELLERFDATESKTIHSPWDFRSKASFKALMSLSVAMHWDVTQLDVGSAFTNTSLEEDVYMRMMRCPQGIHDKPKVCKLLRAPYGLKQAPRAWYLNFLATLKRDGWTRCATDACLFKKQDSTKQWMYLLVYVDDILVAGSDIGRSETEAYLKTNYNMTVAGRPKDFLGFEVNYVRKGEDPNGKGYCILHQTRYVNELLERFDATEYKTIHSPWDSEAKLCKADEAAEGEKLDFPYREFCGAVIYLRTRPDITYTVNKLCKWMQNPGEKMVLAAKRLLRYLKTYPDGGISFGVNRFESDQPAVERCYEEGWC